MTSANPSHPNTLSNKKDKKHYIIVRDNRMEHRVQCWQSYLIGNFAINFPRAVRPACGLSSSTPLREFKMASILLIADI